MICGCAIDFQFMSYVKTEDQLFSVFEVFNDGGDKGEKLHIVCKVTGEILF